MIIKSIELENIRSYKNDIIEFNEGINFLSGDIGSGKSTILLAIEFALLGFKRGDLEGYQLLRKGEREGNVKINLTSNNQNIEIYRKIKKGKSNDNISQENGYIKIDDNLVELSPQEINAKVFEILGFPSEFISKDKNLIYRFTIYTPQEQLKEILFSENEKKLEVIRKLFNIDKYKQLSDAISIFLTNMKTDKKIIESKLEGSSNINKETEDLTIELNNLDKEFKIYKEKETPIKEKMSKCKSAISKRDEFLKKTNNQILIIEKNLTTISEIEKSSIELENKLNEKRKTQKESSQKSILDKKKKIEDVVNLLKKELDSIESEKLKFKNMNELSENLNIKKIKLESESRDILEQKKLIKSKEESFDYVLTKCQLKDSQVLYAKLFSELKKYDKLKLKYDEINEDIIKSNSKVENLKNNLKDKESFEEEINSLDTCPTCLQEVDCSHKNKIIKKNKAYLEIYNKEIKQFEKNIKLDELEKNKLSKDLIKFEEVERQLLEVGEKIKLLLDKERKEKSQYDELMKLKTKTKLLESKEKNNELELNNKEIDKLKLDLKEQDKLIDKDKELTAKVSEYKLELLGLENQFENYELISKEILEIEEKIESNFEKIKSKDTLNEKLNAIKDRNLEITLSKDKYNEMLDRLYEKDKLISNKLSSLNAQIQNKKTELTNKEKLKEEILKIESEFKLMIYKEKFLSDKVVKISSLIERAIFTKYYVEFNEEFERLFRDLIEDNEIEVRLDDDFSIIIEQNGYDIDIKNLSGGEKSSLAIAYRLGLKKIIENNLKERQKLSLLILDEPTDGFSNEQIDRLGNILKGSDLKQIILVSHDEKIESIADSVLKINKVNHISCVN